MSTDSCFYRREKEAPAPRAWGRGRRVDGRRRSRQKSRMSFTRNAPERARDRLFPPKTGRERQESVYLAVQHVAHAAMFSEQFASFGRVDGTGRQRPSQHDDLGLLFAGRGRPNPAPAALDLGVQIFVVE